MGISFSSELNGNKFPYGIGVEYAWGVELEVYPSQDISARTIPAKSGFR